jgi:DNA-binding IclR family transcriptional regulator
VIGEAGVAAPIFDRRAEAVGAVDIAGPRSRLLTRSQEPTVAAAVLEAARGISRDLGTPRWPTT